MPTLIPLLVQFGLQYGPEAVTSIIALLKNTGATIQDVEAAFANLKPYSAYNINPPAAATTTTTPPAAVYTTTPPTALPL